MPEDRLLGEERGSVIVIIATDAPLSPLSLKALAKRAALGIGRSGTPGGNSSGDIFLAFSTADATAMRDRDALVRSVSELNPEHIDPVYTAVVDAVDEAVINALVAGEDVPTVKPRGAICKALDRERLAGFFAVVKP